MNVVLVPLTRDEPGCLEAARGLPGTDGCCQKRRNAVIAGQDNPGVCVSSAGGPGKTEINTIIRIRRTSISCALPDGFAAGGIFVRAALLPVVVGT